MDYNLVMGGFDSQHSDDDWYALPAVERARKRKSRRAAFDLQRDLMPYQIVLSGKPIRLEQVEYRLLVFLAKRPYYAFSVRQILQGIQAEDEPEMTEKSLRDLVRSLRDKLGFFWDFVQAVPGGGYRFKP